MKKTYAIFLVVMASFSTGCTIDHLIAEDYGQYLAENEGRSELPKTVIEAEYFMEKELVDHRFEFRAWIGGYGNLCRALNAIVIV